MAHLSDNLLFQIPRQDEQIVGTGLLDRRYRIDRDVRARRVAAMLVGIAVHGEIEEVRSNTAVVEQGIAFAGRAIGAYLGTFILALNEKREDLPFGAMNLCGELAIGPEILKANLKFPGNECGNRR